MRERTQQGGVVYQDNHIAYDALGRMRWVADTRVYVHIDYDKVGNRTRVAISGLDEPGGNGARHYQYDAMNRQTVVDAVDAHGTLGADGHRLTCDLNGNRASDTHNGVRIVHWTGQGEVQAGEITEADNQHAPGPELGTSINGGSVITTKVL